MADSFRFISAGVFNCLHLAFRHSPLNFNRFDVRALGMPFQELIINPQLNVELYLFLQSHFIKFNLSQKGKALLNNGTNCFI